MKRQSELPVWATALVFIAAAGATVGIGFGCSASVSKSLSVTGGRAVSAPPGPVFAVVWTVLYALAGCAAVYQGMSCTTPAHWVSLCLLIAVVVVAWSWPVIWQQAVVDRTMAFGAPAWAIMAMLMVGGTALVLTPSQTSAALWAPLLLWLVIALGLCLQGQSENKIEGSFFSSQHENIK